jgi:hypothetical protein
MTVGKGIAAGDFLSAGLRRSDDTATSAREPLPAGAPAPLRERYGRATYYLRPDQIAWAKKAAKEIASDGSVSASDIARVALEAWCSMQPCHRGPGCRTSRR